MRDVTTTLSLSLSYHSKTASKRFQKKRVRKIYEREKKREREIEKKKNSEHPPRAGTVMNIFNYSGRRAHTEIE